MTTTPDRFPGDREEDVLALQDNADGDPANPGEVKYDGGAFRMRDSTGVFDPRTGGSGLSEAAHEALDTLAHGLTETHALSVSRDGAGRVSEVLAEATLGGTDIRKTEILTRTASGKVATLRSTQYEGDGTTVKRQLDRTVVRDANGRVTRIDTTRTT